MFSKRSHENIGHLVLVAVVAGLQLGAIESGFAEDAILQSSDVTLSSGIPDTGQYGFGWGSGTNQRGLVAWFVSPNESLEFSVKGYDIDSNAEVRLLLNGQHVGYLSDGANNRLNNGNTFILTAEAQINGLNEIRFEIQEPAIHDGTWGVTDLLLTKVDDSLTVSFGSSGLNAILSSEEDELLEASAEDRDGSIIDAALATMAPDTWRKLNLNQFQDVWTPVGLRPNSTSPSHNISGWSGAAWDSLRDKFYIWGGNIGMEEGNEIYSFNARNGMWERGSLPSAIPPGYTTTTRPSVVGGIFDAPLSGESWDNVIYLENMDRMAILGISRNSRTWRDPTDYTLTGPYFWNPAKANPNKVGGSNGTGVDPTTPGGNMWENRDNQVTSRQLGGTTVFVDNDGVDEVLFCDTRGNIWRYSVDPFNSTSDRWKRLTKRPASGRNAQGAAAYDPTRKIYFRSGNLPNTLLYWDLNRESEGIFPGETVLLDPSLGRTIYFKDFGMDYDPVLDKLVLWKGEDNIIQIDIEDLTSADVTGVQYTRGFFQIDEILPAGMDTPFDTGSGPFTGVFGKWHYMKDKNAFIGVIDPVAGDIWIYKSNDLGSPDSNYQ